MNTLSMTNAIRILLLAAGFFAFAGCSAPAPREWEGGRHARLDTAMMLYKPVNTVGGAFSVKRRHQRVARFYSARVNQLFDRWETLDARFHRLLRRTGEKNITLVEGVGTLIWWHEFTSPVVGCHEYTDSIRFNRPTDSTDWTITMEYRGTGPMGASTYREILTLYFIEENRKPVVDQVRYHERFRHSYLPNLNSDTTGTLDDYIAKRCERWEYWIGKLETWLQSEKSHVKR
jgi:hypothetical protein